MEEETPLMKLTLNKNQIALLLYSNSPSKRVHLLSFHHHSFKYSIMKNFSALFIFCTCILCFSIACGSDQSTDTTDKETISLKEIKAGQTVNEVPITTDEVSETPTAAEEMTEKEEAAPAEELTEKSAPSVKEKTEKAKDREQLVEKKPAVKKKRRKGIMQFSEKTYKFGTITEGKKVEHKFFFTNVGDKPVNVKEASATCGCTYPSHPFVPIKPGEKSYIGVTFNSKGKEGKQRPKVTVVTDSDLGTFNLYLDGKVEKVVEEEAPKEAEKKDENE